MRIEQLNLAASQTAGESTSQGVRGDHAAVPQTSIPEDSTTLSSNQDSVSSLVRTAMQSPEIRQDKVASLQQAINSGQYDLDPAKIAAAIVDEHA